MQITTSKIRVAIVHDALIEYGGGEKVLDVLTNVLPHADVYTSAVNKAQFSLALLPKRVTTTWIDRVSFVYSLPRTIQLLSPFVWTTINVQNYDIIISHGGFYMAHLVHLRRPQNTFSVHYAITPPINLYFGYHRRWFELPLHVSWYHALRYFDRLAASRVDRLWTVSQDVQKRIQLIYKRSASVLYPPISTPATPSLLHKHRRIFYCYAGRLDNEKRIHTIINAFNANRLPLLIVGTGKAEQWLKQQVKPNIVFIKRQQAHNLRQIFFKTKAFIHAAIDDAFPLAPVEAMACGAPVIAFRSGGIQEAIIEGKTGLFYDSHTPEAINACVRRFESRRFSSLCCYNQANNFSVNNFQSNFKSRLNLEYETYIKTKNSHRS